jgi:hypothetical protein
MKQKGQTYMKLIETKNAVGHVLCHDMTQIIPGVSKGPRFQKGHIVQEEDIPVLLSMGKENLYVWEQTEGMLHENDAAQILYSMCENPHMTPSKPKEGKIDLTASIDGLLKIDEERLLKVNSLGEMMIATLSNHIPVKKGEKIAGMRVIPLMIEQEKMDRAKEAAGEGSLMEILPYTHKKVGILATGNEVAKGLIEDAFTPVLKEKLSAYDVEILPVLYPGDDQKVITEGIMNFLDQGCDLVLCTGGMSVDPDDRTPGAIKATGAQIVTYGAPVLPGAMFLLSYLNGKTICGLPGCVMYARSTIFDLMLPRIMADDPISREDIARLGVGGLCRLCQVCTYPNCGFGK